MGESTAMTTDYAHESMSMVKSRIHRVYPLLHLSGEWSVHDAEGRNQDLRDATQLLHERGMINKVETKQVKQKYIIDDYEERHYRATTTYNVWEWSSSDLKDRLLNYHDGLEKLPCGHRSHIYNLRKVDGLSCKYCEEEGKELPEYSKELVKECL